jgi:hypothetical protein
MTHVDIALQVLMSMRSLLDMVETAQEAETWARGFSENMARSHHRSLPFEFY